MHENLQKHRQMRSGPSGPRAQVSNFNGPFFKLEEVSPRPRSQSVVPETNGYQREFYETREESNLHQMRHISASEVELTRHNREDPSIVIWPPIDDKNRRRPSSVMAKNIHDPEREAEYQRQKRQEHEAMRRQEELKMISMSKQIRAIQIQQQKLYEQQHGVTQPVPMMDPNSPPPPPPPKQNQYPPHYSQQQPPPQQHYATTVSPPYEPNDVPPQQVRVFETRPISAMSEDPREAMSPATTSWKRTYQVGKPKDIAKNEILTSDEILEKEQYEVDLLKRREAFVEKLDEPPSINRTGKRWQPPPDKPYVWPSLRRPISVEPDMEPMDFQPGVPRSLEDEEYKWAPVINEPGYKHEHKNFTPQHSPPASPRRGHGTGPLDEPARRQTKYVIQPSPDGSHRPKPAFRKERHAPSGGFYPHAPNAIKIVKRRAASAQGLLAPSDEVEVIHHRNYHRLEQPIYGSESGRPVRDSRTGSETDLRHVPDWEKIYELPPHSSQIVSKEIPKHVDVRRRLSQFEGSIQNLHQRSLQQMQQIQRTSSVESSQSMPHYPLPDYDPSLPHPPAPPPPPPPPPMQTTPQKHRRERHLTNDSNVLYRQTPTQRDMSRRNSLSSTRIETPPASRQQHHHHHHHRQTPQQRIPSRGAVSPGASRARNYIARATAPSPTPYAYDRARPYVPPALPSGYRLGDAPPDLRATSPSPGHTKKMIRTVSESAQRLNPTPQTSRAPSRTHSTRLNSPNPRFL